MTPPLSMIVRTSKQTHTPNKPLTYTDILKVPYKHTQTKTQQPLYKIHNPIQHPRPPRLGPSRQSTASTLNLKKIGISPQKGHLEVGIASLIGDMMQAFTLLQKNFVMLANTNMTHTGKL